jgi:hypothetical protein
MAFGTTWTYSGTLVKAATHVGFLVDGVYCTIDEATALRDEATGRLRVELTEAMEQYARWQRSTGGTRGH